MTPSTTHLVLIPSYNTGVPRLLATVQFERTLVGQRFVAPPVERQ